MWPPSREGSAQLVVSRSMLVGNLLITWVADPPRPCQEAILEWVLALFTPGGGTLRPGHRHKLCVTGFSLTHVFSSTIWLYLSYVTFFWWVATLFIEYMSVLFWYILIVVDIFSLFSMFLNSALGGATQVGLPWQPFGTHQCGLRKGVETSTALWSLQVYQQICHWTLSYDDVLLCLSMDIKWYYSPCFDAYDSLWCFTLWCLFLCHCLVGGNVHSFQCLTLFDPGGPSQCSDLSRSWRNRTWALSRVQISL